MNRSDEWVGKCRRENIFGLSGAEDVWNMKDHKGGECLTT